MLLRGATNPAAGTPGRCFYLFIHYDLLYFAFYFTLVAPPPPLPGLLQGCVCVCVCVCVCMCVMLSFPLFRSIRLAPVSARERERERERESERERRLGTKLDNEGCRA
jgi:hypothetical protein